MEKRATFGIFWHIFSKVACRARIPPPPFIAHSFVQGEGGFNMIRTVYIQMEKLSSGPSRALLLRAKNT